MELGLLYMNVFRKTTSPAETLKSQNAFYLPGWKNSPTS